MFIGHYAVGLAAKRAAPEVSLGTLFLSTQFLDLLWPILLLFGIEHVRIDPGNTPVTPLDFYDYPISHSLLMVIVWSIAFGLIYFAIRRYRIGALVVGLGVLSHWILDFITHRPDLPLAPGSNRNVGLGSWYSVPASIIVEGAFFLAGVIVYTRFTKPTDRVGRYAYWALIAFLVVVWIMNMLGGAPPNEQVIAYSALLLWLLVPWGYWIDRHRQTINALTDSGDTRYAAGTVD